MVAQFDEILTRIGDFGFYQKRTYALLSLPAVSVGSFMMMVIVVMYTPEHRCKIPSLYNDTYKVQSIDHETMINATIPYNTDDDDDVIYDRCHIYIRDDNDDDGGGSKQSNFTKVQCQEWVYDQTIFVRTFTSQLNLVCDNALKTSHIQMFFYFGVLVGDLLLGLLSDKIGRVKSMCIAFLLLIVCSLAVSFVREFYTFAVLQFIIGGCSHGGFMCISVLGMEMVGPTKRLWTGMLQQVFFAVGVCYLALMGYLARDWMWINLACALPCILYISYYWIIPESARWLISMDRKNEALTVIRKTVLVNKVDITESKYDVRQIDVQKSSSEGKLWDVFTHPVLRGRILILSFNWMIVSMTYYGVTMNSGNMGGSFFLNFMLMGLVEIPGVFIGMALIDRTGRRWSNGCTMIVGGLACISTIPVVLLGNTNLQPLAITLALIGKCSAAAAFAIVYMFTAEISPTVIRNAVMGLCSCSARVGGMLAPYIAKSGELIGGKFGVIEPLLVFGVLSILAGLCLFLLPETLNKKLPDTIQDGEQFGRVPQPGDKEIELPFITDKDKKNVD